MIYSKINEFCSVRNAGNCYKNGTQPTPRVKFLMELLKSEGIEFELDVFAEEEKSNFFDWDDEPIWTRFRNRKTGDRFESKPKPPKQAPKPRNNFFNIILRGTSNRMVVAHHDIQNPNIDNANDNSASVINAIALKKMRPDLHIVLLDGEEMGGIGSERVAKQIKDNKFGQIEWVLNLELTGKGGTYFFIGEYPGKLYDRIKSLFNCPSVRTPFNDSVTIRKFGIDSCVINPLPPLPEGETSMVQAPDGKYLDYKMLYHCHNEKDTLASISVDDMKTFVEEVLIKIVS